MDTPKLRELVKLFGHKKILATMKENVQLDKPKRAG